MTVQVGAALGFSIIRRAGSTPGTSTSYSLRLRTSKCYLMGMQFEPDIVVTSPGESRPSLVVEAKLQSHVAAPLKHYMLRMRSPAGRR